MTDRQNPSRRMPMELDMEWPERARGHESECRLTAESGFGPRRDTRLYTVGYGTRSLDQFIALLRQYEIGVLVDVRSAPHSRYKPEFSREPLAVRLKQDAIEYRFLGATLGGRPTDPTCYSNGKVDYARMRLQEAFQSGMDQLGVILREPKRVALMCSEGRPEECHRSKLIGEAATACGITVLHIDEGDQLRTQHEIVMRLTGGQMDLFGPAAFQSRKRHGGRTREEREGGRTDRPPGSP